MDEEQKKPPTSALNLFVDMYCKKTENSDKSDRCLVNKALRAWTSLANEEKQHFEDAFEELRKRYKTKLAEHLKSIEPYLKEKRTHVDQQNPSVAIDIDDTEEPHPVDSNEDTKRHDDDCVNTSQNFNNGESSFGQPSEPDLRDDYFDYQDENINLMTEPSPPAVKNGKELFDMVKSTDKNTRVNWLNLTQPEKYRYSRAVLKLKQEYIRNYKAFLESLSSRELYNFYNQKISE